MRFILFALIMLGGSGTGFSVSVEETLSVAKAVVAELSNNGSNMSDATLSQALGQLHNTLAILKNDVGSENCVDYVFSHTSLGRSDAKLICEGSTAAVAECYNQGYSGTSLSSSQTIDLCTGGGTTATVDCYKEAYSGTSLSSDQSIRLCKRGGTTARVYCFKNSSGSTDDALKECSGN